MNILEQKVNHPTKGPLELGRWSKTDLVKVILEQNRLILNQQNQFYWIDYYTDLILAKVLIEIPEAYKYLLDYKLAFMGIEDSLDMNEIPQIPMGTISFLRVDKNDSRAD